MALFSNPVTLSDDGGTTTDREYSFLAQDTSNPNTVAGKWIEDSADPTAESELVVKHDQRTLPKGFRRDLFSTRIKLHPAADTETDDLQLITINTTIIADKRFSSSEIQPMLNIHTDAMEETDFLSGLRQGKI